MRKDEYNQQNIVNDRQNIDAEFTHAQRSEYSSFNHEYKDYKYELNDKDLKNERSVIRKKKEKVLLNKKPKEAAISLAYAYAPHVIVAASIVGLIVAGTSFGLKLFPTGEEEGQSTPNYAINGQVEERSISIQVEIPFSHFLSFNEESGEPIIGENQFIAKLIEDNQYSYDIECTYECNIDEKIVTVYSSCADLKYDTDYKMGIYELKEEQYVLISEEYSFHTDKNEQPGPEPGPDPSERVLPNPEVQISGQRVLIYVYLDFTYFDETNPETGYPVVDEGQFAALVYYSDSNSEYKDCDLDLSPEGDKLAVYIMLQNYPAGNYYVKFIDNINGLETDKVAFNIEGEETSLYNVVTSKCDDNKIEIYFEVPYSHYEGTDSDTGKPYVNTSYFKGRLVGTDNDYSYDADIDKYEYDDTNSKVQIYFSYTSVDYGTYYFVGLEYIDSVFTEVTEHIELKMIEKVITIGTPSVNEQTATVTATVDYIYFDEFDSVTGNPVISEGQFVAYVVPESSSDYTQLVAEYQFDSTNKVVTLTASFENLLGNTYYYTWFADTVNNRYSQQANFLTEAIAPTTIEVHLIEIADGNGSFYIELPYSYFTDFDGLNPPSIESGRFKARTGTDSITHNLTCTWTFDDVNQMVKIEANDTDIPTGVEWMVAFFDDDMQLTEYYHFPT